MIEWRYTSRVHTQTYSDEKQARFLFKIYINDHNVAWARLTERVPLAVIDIKRRYRHKTLAVHNSHNDPYPHGYNFT